MIPSTQRKKAKIADPSNLLEVVMLRLNAKNDADLSRALDVSAPVISKIRNRRTSLTASMKIRIHEETGLSIREINTLIDPSYKPVNPHKSASNDSLTSDATGAG